MAVKTKAQILAEIVALFADNTTGDISASDLRTVTTDIVDSYFDAPYKKYVALLTQTGTNAPVATVLENTLSGTPVWSRNTNGSYSLTLASEFVNGKTIVTGQMVDGSNLQFLAIDNNSNYPNTIDFITQLSGVATDSQFNNTYIEIRVYP